MKRENLILFLIILAIPFMFKAVDGLLQHPAIYSNTLGKISDNYAFRGKPGHIKLVLEKTPYLTPDKTNFYNWDGAYYNLLRDSLYTHSDMHLDRPAFFPLYPLLLRTLPTTPTVVFLFNVLLFTFSVFLLARFCFPNTINYYLVVLGLLIPTTVVFYMPYAESLLMLSVAIAVTGLHQKKYWLFCLGMFAFSMTRPTVFMFLAALLLTDIAYYLQHKNFKYLFIELLKKSLPVALGLAVVIFLQYRATGSLTAYFDANSIWQIESGFFGNEVSDWSSEGFGMNTFAIFLIMLPATLFAIFWAIRKSISKDKTPTPSLFEGNNTFNKEYMFILSIFFLACNALMLIFMSGGALNGYARYTMAVPFFYIVLFQLPQRLAHISLKLKIPCVLSCVVLLFVFLNNVRYTGNLHRFAYLGLYLLLALLLFFLLEPHLPQKTKAVILLLLILPCIVWQTYLFNMYLSNAWIFT